MQHNSITYFPIERNITDEITMTLMFVAIFLGMALMVLFLLIDPPTSLKDNEHAEEDARLEAFADEMCASSERR